MGGFAPIPSAAPTVVTGVRDLSTVQGARVKVDMKDRLVMTRPSAAPLTAITSKLKDKRIVTQYKYDQLSKDEYPREATVTVAATAVATQVQLQAGHGARFAKYYVVMNRRTREHMLVTDFAGGVDLPTVVRGIGGGNEAIEVGDKLEYQRAVYPDGANLGTLKSIAEGTDFNYTEIIRTPFGQTGRDENTSMFGGKDPNTERKWQSIVHTTNIEKAFLFGRRYIRTDPGTNTFQTFTGGLDYFIRTNRWNLGGNELTERGFIDWLEYAMQKGKGGNEQSEGMKYFFHAPHIGTIIERWARDKIQYRILDKRVGIKVGFFDTGHGTVVLVRNPILSGTYDGGMGFLIDLNHASFVAHQGRDTKLFDKRQANDLDGTIEEYLSDVGCEVELEQAHGIIEGVPLTQ